LKKYNINLIKIAAVLLLVFLVTTSAVQAGVKINNIGDSNDTQDPTISVSYLDDIFTWEDDFEETNPKIDISASEHYDIDDGQVVMVPTIPQWTNPSFTRMKEITLTSNKDRVDYAVKIIVDHDSDMRNDYGDLRFKYNGQDFWLDYWIEAKYPNDHAVVWVKFETLVSGSGNDLFMFYGNPSATDQSNYDAVFGEDSWKESKPFDERVSYKDTTEGAWDPAVAYGKYNSQDAFFIAWEEGYVFPVQQEIRGRFVDPDCNLLGSELEIAPKGSIIWHYEEPSVAYGNGVYFIAYEHYLFPGSPDPVKRKIRDIEGAVLSSSGSFIKKNIKITNDPDANQASPFVVYGNGRFFVTWEDAREDWYNYDIYGKFYNTNGNAAGGEIALNLDQYCQLDPFVCYDDEHKHYMIVWEEGVDPETGPFDVHGQLFDINGGDLGSAVALSPAGNTIDYNFPTVAYCKATDTYLAGWQKDDWGVTYKGPIQGHLIDHNGQKIGGMFEIDDGLDKRAFVVPYLETSFFVSYDNGGAIWGKLVSSTGAVTNSAQRLSKEGTADWPDMSVGSGKILVTWEDERQTSNPDIYINSWTMSIPGETDVTVDPGPEQTMELSAMITSIKINPTNWFKWDEFEADFDGNVKFDILDGNSLNVIKSDVSSGSSISTVNQGDIRLRARFGRTNPSSSPYLDSWKLTFRGIDREPPDTDVDYVDGIEGLNGWYTSRKVTIHLSAQDFPEEYGTPTEEIRTYFTIDGGGTQTYNKNGGIELEVFNTAESLLTGEFTVNFWSKDNADNQEDKHKEGNTIVIKIDADRPDFPEECWLEPASEEEVEIPFNVRLEPRDNVGITTVFFDIEPFGERNGYPIEKSDGDDGSLDGIFTWLCDANQISNAKPKILLNGDDNSDEIQNPDGDIRPASVSVWVKARAYDASGQYEEENLWVTITNWESTSKSLSKTLINKKPLLNALKFGFAIDDSLNIDIPVSKDIDSVKIVATKVLTRKQTTIWDNNMKDGCSASFDLPTGLYKITTFSYKEDEQIAKNLVARVFYISR